MRVNRIVKQAGGLGIEQLDPLRQEPRFQAVLRELKFQD
jgi:hypothetical protein